jgi:hypothetical protein
MTNRFLDTVFGPDHAAVKILKAIPSELGSAYNSFAAWSMEYTNRMNGAEATATGNQAIKLWKEGRISDSLKVGFEANGQAYKHMAGQVGEAIAAAVDYAGDALGAPSHGLQASIAGQISRAVCK